MSDSFRRQTNSTLMKTKRSFSIKSLFTAWAILSITHAALGTAPSATTLAPSSITTTSAQFNGTINPNGTSTSAYFDYGTTTGYGSSSNPGSFGSGTSPVSVNTTLSGASPNTTYHYRVVAVNSAGQVTYGGDMSFTTLAATTAPSATTLAPTSITTTSAQFNGTINPNGTSTSAYFDYGTTSSYGTSSNPGSFGSGTSPVSVNTTLSGASPNTTYHYRVVAVNSAGQVTYGGDMSFTTLAATTAPSATTLAPTSITTTSAQFNGTINPNGTSTSAYFDYGTTSSYGTSSNPGSFGSGTSPVSVNTTLSGASPNTTYHYRVVAVNSAGQVTYGGDMSFTTLAAVAAPVLAVNPTSASVAATAGSTTFSVNNTGGGTMSYSTGSPSVSWLHVTSGGTGGNSGTINVSYDANTGAQRSGTVQVTASGATGSPVTITITQSGALSGGILYGIDISHHQNDAGPINWANVQSANISFVFVKASEGTDIPDGYNDSLPNHPISDHTAGNVQGAQSNGLIAGVYHLADGGTNSAVAEAQYFLARAGSYIGSGYLPPTLDIEDGAGSFQPSHLNPLNGFKPGLHMSKIKHT